MNKIEFFVFFHSSENSGTSLSSNLDTRSLDSFFSNMVLMFFSSADIGQKKTQFYRIINLDNRCIELVKRNSYRKFHLPSLFDITCELSLNRLSAFLFGFGCNFAVL